MCPFCIGTAVWIAAGAVTTGGVSAIAITKLWNKKSREPQPTALTGDSSAPPSQRS
ncbi:hypothetical protein [Granulicella sp. L46]|uniref:hypothetical protein n=1 Tax=Granulicella sp. L46 TaxID=1641865 RepID=UPI00131C0B53|nr:hypothetical protein [Granulicella sp. L46]